MVLQSNQLSQREKYVEVQNVVVAVNASKYLISFNMVVEIYVVEDKQEANYVAIWEGKQANTNILETNFREMDRNVI